MPLVFFPLWERNFLYPYPHHFSTGRNTRDLLLFFNRQLPLAVSVRHACAQCVTVWLQIQMWRLVPTALSDIKWTRISLKQPHICPPHILTPQTATADRVVQWVLCKIHVHAWGDLQSSQWDQWKEAMVTGRCGIDSNVSEYLMSLMSYYVRDKGDEHHPVRVAEVIIISIWRPMSSGILNDLGWMFHHNSSDKVADGRHSCAIPPWDHCHLFRIVQISQVM